MNKYEINTMKKKKAIIQAALSLFSTNGFLHVTIKEIAALANVSQVSIYNYFGSKEELLTHCVEEVLQTAIDKARDILSQNISFIEKIQLALSVGTSEISIAISNVFSQNALNEPDLYNLLMENINTKKRALYLEYIEYGKQEGVIDSGLSTNMILDFLEAINMSSSTKQADTNELPTLFHLLMYGLVGRP